MKESQAMRWPMRFGWK